MKFKRKILIIGDFEKPSFLNQPFWIKKMKKSQSLLVSKDESNFEGECNSSHYPKYLLLSVVGGKFVKTVKI